MRRHHLLAVVLVGVAVGLFIFFARERKSAHRESELPTSADAARLDAAVAPESR